MKKQKIILAILAILTLFAAPGAWADGNAKLRLAPANVDVSAGGERIESRGTLMNSEGEEVEYYALNDVSGQDLPEGLNLSFDHKSIFVSAAAECPANTYHFSIAAFNENGSQLCDAVEFNVTVASSVTDIYNLTLTPASVDVSAGGEVLNIDSALTKNGAEETNYALRLSSGQSLPAGLELSCSGQSISVSAAAECPADTYTISIEAVNEEDMLLGSPVSLTVTVISSTKPSIALDNTAMQLSVGSSGTLTATVTDPSGLPHVVRFSITDGGSYVTIVDNGDGSCKVNGIVAGTATVRATVYGYDDVYADCRVTVASVTPPGPIDPPAPEPVKPTIGNVSDEVKAEIKPEMAANETNVASAAEKIGGALTSGDLTLNGDGKVTAASAVAVNIVANMGTLNSVTSKDVVALPVFSTQASPDDTGKTVMIAYRVLGSDLKKTNPADVKVLKILGANSGELFSYTNAITTDMDKKFTIQADDDTGTIYSGEINANVYYRLVLFIKDGGAFDLDRRTDGAVADPSVILGTDAKNNGGGSSGGCNAGLGALALLAIALLPALYKKKR
ncbi:MAG: Synerg-CTERM sorting domain-containing protein [Synergistaceae bacterium]|nr:Synerg-CTERM sorting domain-containing protein [Synergistaceae bacterium]